MNLLSLLAADEYLQGISDIGFTDEKIPEFKEMNAKLQQLTGWKVLVAPGIINDPEFFRLLSEQKFPATAWLRNKSQLDYLSEPDMFHDVFVHVPLLTNKWFCDFFKPLGVSEQGILITNKS
jgi:phenylalanine-4-hydroxylase